MRNVIAATAIAMVAAITVTPPSYAAGLIGGFIDNFCHPCGEQLDQWHREVKDHNPTYKGAEEGLGKAVREHPEILGPLLGN